MPRTSNHFYQYFMKIMQILERALSIGGWIRYYFRNNSKFKYGYGSPIVSGLGHIPHTTAKPRADRAKCHSVGQSVASLGPAIIQSLSQPATQANSCQPDIRPGS